MKGAPGKAGRCGAYRSPKTKYWKRNVAMFDCAVLKKAHPELSFEVFRCRSCRAWHIGSTLSE